MKGRLVVMTETVPLERAAVERRRARRFEVDWEVVVKGKDDLGSSVHELGNLRDLSSRGAFLSMVSHLKVGMRLELWIRMPSAPERWIAYTAEIVRIGEKGLGGLGAATRFLTARPKLHTAPAAGPGEESKITRGRSSTESSN